MPDNEKEALDQLLESLRRENASELEEEIRTVISRGTTREVESKGRQRELAQEPLTDREAYAVALDMLIASLEPLILRERARVELTGLIPDGAKITWQPDYIEESPIAPEFDGNANIPEVKEKDIRALGRDLADLIRLMEGE